MVLDLDGQPLIVWVQRRAARDGPGLEHAVEFKAQVVVQPGRVVLLDHEAQAIRGPCRRGTLGFPGLGEVALGLVSRQFVHSQPLNRV